jgi:manganese oxidase
MRTDTPLHNTAAADTEQIKDTYAGLEGVIIIFKQGLLNDQNVATDAQEFVLMLKVNNENKSWFLQENCAAHHIDEKDCSTDNGEFEESNLMHAINGRVYANLPGLTMKAGANVRWFLASFGTEVRPATYAS